MYRFKTSSKNVKTNKKQKQSVELEAEVAQASAFSLRSPWQNSVGGLTPEKLSLIIENSNNNDSSDYLSLAEEIEEKDWHYRNCISMRKNSVASIACNVLASAEDDFSKKIASEIQELTYSPNFREMMYALMDALSKGYSVAEIVWELKNSKWVPQDYKWRDPRFFKFDQKTGEELLLITDQNPLGETLKPYKFIVHSPRLKMGLPARAGLARLAMLGWLFKRSALIDWQVFARQFGKPVKIGRYPNSAGAKEQRSLANAIAQLSQDSGMIIPDSMMLELHDAFSGSSNGDVFKNFATYIDEQVSKCVLGQTMSSDSGGSLAQAMVHNEVRMDLIASDAQQLANTLNSTLVKYYIDLNYGVQDKYPEITIKLAEKNDIELLSKALPPFIDRGLQVPDYYLREMFKIPEVGKNDSVIGEKNKTALNTAVSQNKTVVAMEEQKNDEIDNLVDLALADWEPLIDPVIDPLFALVDEAESLEEIKKKLGDVLEKMNASKLVKSLATKTFTARGIGDAKDGLDV